MTNKDHLIIQKVLQGNTNAFAELVTAYKDLVFTLALKMVKNRKEAEEVSQDTFIKAFKNLSKFKGDSKFSTWLYKITYHNCLDRFKKNEKEYRTSSIETLASFNVSSSDDVLKSMEREERAEMLKNCLEKLPEEERTILWFFYYKELSLKEIIEVTQFSEANIKVKLHRARKRLLAIVKERFEPEMIAHYGKK
ncbi:RNA polymerase [Polaribacter sp. SA4-10]|uniref:RNA polymerase sigma factor n=1 Tax=Polaribacter sp. SA4-10 TaxID=754397 RepID=UPI000B3D2721|nr:sigma-70 family RNA polymerase sigma factor [Polaribacter sp. SA4-10]ARV07781.1 RNA polymerase [Polaribacter sp. SA4-10]